MPVEFRLPLTSKGDDALQEMMERKREADFEHGFTQQLGMTDEQVKLFAMSRSLLKSQLRAERGSTARGVKADHYANPWHDDAEGDGGAPAAPGMSAVHLAMKDMRIKTLERSETENADLLEQHQTLQERQVVEMQTFQRQALAEASQLRLREAQLARELKQTQTALRSATRKASPAAAMKSVLAAHKFKAASAAEKVGASYQSEGGESMRSLFELSGAAAPEAEPEPEPEPEPEMEPEMGVVQEDPDVAEEQPAADEAAAEMEAQTDGPRP